MVQWFCVLAVLMVVGISLENAWGMGEDELAYGTTFRAYQTLCEENGKMFGILTPPSEELLIQFSCIYRPPKPPLTEEAEAAIFRLLHSECGYDVLPPPRPVLVDMTLCGCCPADVTKLLGKKSLFRADYTISQDLQDDEYTGALLNGLSKEGRKIFGTFLEQTVGAYNERDTILKAIGQHNPKLAQTILQKLDFYNQGISLQDLTLSMHLLGLSRKVLTALSKKWDAEQKGQEFRLKIDNNCQCQAVRAVNAQLLILPGLKGMYEQHVTANPDEILDATSKEPPLPRFEVFQKLLGQVGSDRDSGFVDGPPQQTWQQELLKALGKDKKKPSEELHQKRRMLGGEGAQSLNPTNPTQNSIEHPPAGEMLTRQRLERTMSLRLFFSKQKNKKPGKTNTYVGYPQPSGSQDGLEKVHPDAVAIYSSNRKLKNFFRSLKRTLSFRRSPKSAPRAAQTWRR